MKKVIFLIIVLIFLFMFNTAFAAKEIKVPIDLLITNYKNVDNVVFTRELPNGKITTYKYNTEDIENSQKTKVPNQRIIKFYFDLHNIGPESGDEGNLHITVKMTDGTKIISEEISLYYFIFGKDYVFNSRKMQFNDREIWSRIPSIEVIFYFTLAMLTAYFMVQTIKLIIAAILKIKPLKYILLSSIYLAIILAVFSILGFRFIPVNIFLQVLCIVIGLSFYEYNYINKKCKVQKRTRFLLYVIISKVIECGVVLLMIDIGSMF